MKKLLVICIAVAMLLTMTVSVFAEPGGFIVSPSGKKSPELIAAESQSDECEAKIIITAYSDRHELSEENRKRIEEAYAQIAGSPNLKDLYAFLEELHQDFVLFRHWQLPLISLD